MTKKNEGRKEAKIAYYEKILDEQLRPQLTSVNEAREKLTAQLSKYLELRMNIKLIQKTNSTELKTMFNLGSDFYVEAEIPDASRMFVNVGLGFHVEFTLEEALRFIDSKEEFSNSYLEKLSEEAANIKVKMKLIGQAIDELMGLAPPDEKIKREFVL